MLQVFLFSFLSSFFLICAGSLIKFNEKKIDQISNASERILLGLILISAIALTLNFFTPLTEKINSIIFFSLIFFAIINKKIKNEIININIFKVLIIISIISSLLIFKSNVYKPDALVYHLPYTGIINSEKIILGISNLHHRFGFISIIQYLSAIFNNNVFKEIGIVIPLAIIPACILLNFYSQIFLYLKKKKFLSYHFQFLILISIFIVLKISSYNDFGNDAPGHLIFFFIISEILKNKVSNININKILLLGVFIFLNKISFILILIIPLSLIWLKKFNPDFKTFFITIFLFLWLLKNLLTTGCIIYPIEGTCPTNIKWTSLNNLTLNTKQTLIETEAYSKGFPDQKTFNREDFIKNFTWFATWKKKHMVYIVKKIFPFLIILLIFFIFFKFKSKIKDKKQIINNNKKIKTILIFTFIILVFLFLKSPLYRFIYSSLVLFITFSFIYLCRNIFIFNKINYKFIKFIILTSIIFFVIKQIPRFFKNDNNLWPNTITNEKYDYTTINKVNIKISDSCGYQKVICTNYKNLSNKIIIKHYNNYKIVINN